MLIYKHYIIQAGVHAESLAGEIRADALAAGADIDGGGICRGACAATIARNGR